MSANPILRRECVHCHIKTAIEGRGVCDACEAAYKEQWTTFHLQRNEEELTKLREKNVQLRD